MQFRGLVLNLDAFEHCLEAVQKMLFICLHIWIPPTRKQLLFPESSLWKMYNHRTTDEWEMLHNGTVFSEHCHPCIRYE